jgi:signal transduction histidine kinase
MAEDAQGYLWLGTQGGGLSRFDGSAFHVYTTRDGLLNNNIGYLHIDQRGNVWSAHTQGLSRFDGLRFKEFVIPDSLPIGRINKIVEFRDTIYFSSVSGTLGKIYSDSVYYWNIEQPGGEVYRLHQASVHELYVLLRDGRLIVRTPGKERIINIPSDQIHSLSFLDYNGKRCMVVNGEFYEIDLMQNRLRALGYEYDGYFHFYDSRHQEFWVSTGDQLKKLTLNNNQFKAKTVLTGVTVNQLLSDREANLWVASGGEGLIKYFVQDFFKHELGDTKAIMAVCKDKEGTIWAGSYVKGIISVKQGKTTLYATGHQRKDAVTSLLEDSKGILWAGTYGGLARYNSRGDRFDWIETDNFKNVTIYNLNEDETGTLWIGTRSGFFALRDGVISSVDFETDTENRSISASHYSFFHKALFFGLHQGLYRYKNTVNRYNIPELKNSTVLSIQSYQDSLLLFATSGAGFFVFSPVRGVLANLTSDNGLPSDFVYFIREDKDGSVWIGTEKGITRLILTNNHTINGLRLYNHFNGLTGVETNQNAAWFDDEDKLFGLIDGLYQQNSNSKDFFYDQPIHLTGIKLFYGDQAIAGFAEKLDGFYGVPAGLSLPFDQNHLTFTFHKVNKRHPQSVRYKYKLEGFDGNWSVPTLIGSVTYSNLPPGNYTFSALATNHEGVWHNNGIEYAFEVRAPFFETPLFYVMAGIAAAGLASLIFVWRVRSKVQRLALLQQIRAQEHDKIRKEIARDFHDDMGNQLTRIINYVSLLRLNGNLVKVDELYNKVEGSAKYLYTGTRDFIWAIDPVNDEISMLFLHLRDFAQKMFEESEINFRAYNSIKEIVKLPYGYSRQINLLFKEAMTNAFKHSDAANVKLTLEQHDNLVIVAFEDDGKGFDPDRVKASGIMNMMDRAQKLNGELTISSTPGGTSVSLEFHLNKQYHDRRK